ncbi:MAG: aldo/keto reductase [Burkholderiales bacterium]|nr:aldo/keto reductase [Burkholderiales bacterium]
MNRRNALQVLAMAAGAAHLPGHAVDEKSTSGQKMAMRKIPSTGELLPVLGLGTWQTFDVGAEAAVRSPLEGVLREFSALGGTLIDSSPMYGRSEEVAGDLIAKLGLRAKLFVATKVWTAGKAEGIAQMEASMKKLKARPIELLQVHNLLDVETHLRTLAEWKAARLVRYVGVTHYTPSAYDAVAKVIAAHQVDFLQINYSVGEREAEQRLLPLARERGIAVIVNRPFAGGELIRRLRSTPLPAWAAEIDCTSWAQLLLKFVISHPAATCAIPATARIEHLRDNMGAGAGRMPDEKMRTRIAAGSA